MSLVQRLKAGVCVNKNSHGRHSGFCQLQARGEEQGGGEGKRRG